MLHLTAWPRHQALLRSMYRRLLRGFRKLESAVPVLDTNSTADSPALHRELVKAAKNPQLYGEYLWSELKYRVDEEFRQDHAKINERSLYDSILMAELLIGYQQQLAAPEAKQGAKESKAATWHAVIELLVSLRQKEHERNQWRLAYSQNRREIDQKREKDTDALTAKRLASYRERSTGKAEIFSELPATRREKALRGAIAESHNNAAYVVRNYLKKLQLQGKIPNPYKLPHVPASMSMQMANLPKDDTLIPGSTKTVVVDAAYDPDYIEAIIKPEVEFKINQNHHLACIEEIVTEKGPYQVKIRHTNAGIMKANFIRLPYTRYDDMREIALDIKRLMRAIRKQFIWNLKSANAAGVPEKKLGMGYSVRGSGGYSSAEIMYPREYYEELASQEADWEIRMFLEEHKSKHGADSVSSNLAREKAQKLAKDAHSSWRQALNVSSRAIDEEIQLFYQKYKVGKNDPIWQQQALLQREMDDKFETTLANYADLLANLEADRVFMHSEIYRNGVINTDYQKLLTEEEHKDAKKRHGLPEKERKGYGKKLGDYLEEMGFKGYQMGYKFAQRFRD